MGYLNWHDLPISNGPIEGINKKIKALKRVAYGYRGMRVIAQSHRPLFGGEVYLTGREACEGLFLPPSHPARLSG